MNCIPLKNVKVFEFNTHDIQNSEEVYFVSPAQTLQYYCSSAEKEKKSPCVYLRLEESDVSKGRVN